jgi:broad specificity phosphatase PhoE
MKILFVRHGESEDDLINAYGGWSDFPLTDNGKIQIEQTAQKISELGISFSKIFSSPLSRALSTSKIIGEKLGLEVEIFEYVKERNTYGILSGMIKEDAKAKYPEQVSKLENDEYVDGSERVEDVKTRINTALDILAQNSDPIIVVTHGVFLKNMFPIFGKKLTKKSDGGFTLLEIENNEMKVISSSGIEVE